MHQSLAVTRRLSYPSGTRTAAQQVPPRRQRDSCQYRTDLSVTNICTVTQITLQIAASEQVELGWRKGGNLVSERVECVKPFSSHIWTIGIPDNIIRIYGVT